MLKPIWRNCLRGKKKTGICCQSVWMNWRGKGLNLICWRKWMRWGGPRVWELKPRLWGNGLPGISSLCFSSLFLVCFLGLLGWFYVTTKRGGLVIGDFGSSLFHCRLLWSALVFCCFRGYYLDNNFIFFPKVVILLLFLIYLHHLIILATTFWLEPNKNYFYPHEENLSIIDI